MNIDQRIASLEAELATLKAEVAKPAEEFKPGEVVIVWDGSEENDPPIFDRFERYDNDAGIITAGGGYWRHARRPTTADWIKLGAPVLDIDRLWRENPDAKVITQDGCGGVDKWQYDPSHGKTEWEGENCEGKCLAYPDWKTRIWHRPEGI
jgi:hypothetical protein